jgi:hypothetical protein
MIIVDTMEAWCGLLGYFNCSSVPPNEASLAGASFALVVGSVVGRLITSICA